MKFITLTNKGYLDYTRNMIKSLKKLDIEEPLKVYCIGADCYNCLDYDNKVLLNSEAPDEFQKFREGDWNKVVFQKFNAIYQELIKGNDVLFSDGDIVWLDKRFQRDIQNRIDDNDILFQNDHQDDRDDGELCSGIMFIKSNERNKITFNPENIDMESFKCDQIHLNKIKSGLNYDKLPLKKYPNGRFYYTMKPQNPYCIHFNYVVGEMKKTFMKQYDYWLIE
jgi:hypothetical protein